MNVVHISFRELYNYPSTTYGLFGLYKYPAKFIPHVVLYAIQNYSERNDIVFDPFAGFGSVGIGCILLERNYELWDLNPLLLFLERFFHINSTVKVESVIKTVNSLKNCKGVFVPNWDNINYWYPEEILEELSKVRCAIEEIEEDTIKNILLLSFLKVAKKFSYADEKVFKLNRSKKSIEKMQRFLSKDWKTLLWKELEANAINTIGKLQEHQTLRPKKVKGIVKAGIDVIDCELEDEVDVLLTSPPYLQAQEYIRSTKLELFWLGESQERIRELSRREIPYRKAIPEVAINSETYNIICQNINDKKLKEIYEKYFASIIYAFEKLSRKVRKRMLIFVGSVHVGDVKVPIDAILLEHFKSLGWKHVRTYVDRIKSRNLFANKDNLNPASGRVNSRLETEHLFVLER